MTLITTDNQHYTDIASAIRSKAGVQDLFKPSQMANAIMAIPTGGGASLGSKTITDNGTYYASADSLDGYSQVTVNVSGGGGGGNEDAIIDRTISNIVNNTATAIGYYAFYSAQNLLAVSMGAVLSIGSYAFATCLNLASANFPACTNIDSCAFSQCTSLAFVSFPLCVSVGYDAFFACTNLVNIDLPACETIESYAFSGCKKLAAVSIPECTSIGSSGFTSCWSLSTLSLPKCSVIGGAAFARCFNLVSLYLTAVSSVPNLLNSTAFTSTPIGGYSVSAGQYGSIYVPSSLYADFIAHSRWSWFSDRIVSV